MAVMSKDCSTLCKKVCAATNKIAKCIKADANKIKTNMTDKEVASLQECLLEDVAKLEAICCDPDNPCPC